MRPADCALAFCLPLSHVAFTGAHYAERSDFVRALVMRAGTLGDAWDRYAGALDAAQDALDAVSKLGVTVYEGTRAGVQAAFSTHAAVTVIAHSPAPRIAPSDLLDVEGIMTTIRDGTSPEHTWLRRQLGTGRPGALADNVREEHRADWLARELSWALEDNLRQVTWAAGSAYSDLHLESARPARLDLERIFGAALVPAPVLELADGAVSTAELLALIPEDFHGTAALSACQSSALAQAIKRERPECLIVFNRYDAELGHRLWLYRLMMLGLSEEPLPYVEAATQLRLIIQELPDA